MRHTHRYVRMYDTKRHREGTAEPRSINFGKRRHVDKVSLNANFHPNRQRPLPHFQGRCFDSSTLRSSYVMISQTMTDGKTFLLPTIRKLHVAFRLAYLHVISTHSKGQG